jgi:omega-amidase
MTLLKKMASVLSTASPFKLALVQLGGVGADKTKNLVHTREKILEAAKNGAHVVVLPVSFIAEKLYSSKLTCL